LLKIEENTKGNLKEEPGRKEIPFNLEKQGNLRKP
jgi:hypothetical protein